jgi:SagB-type dehydrogenase family enzyme
LQSGLLRQVVAKGPVRLRRAKTILSYWNNDRFVLENYRTRTLITADPLAVKILDFFSRWRWPEELIQGMPQYSSRGLRAALRQLTERSFLVRENTPEARQDEHLQRAWSNWLPHGSFHFATKNERFIWGQRRNNLLKRYLKESRQPPLFKTYRNVPRVRLPRHESPDGEFLRVLLARKTHRQFSRESLPLSSLSRLLFYTWGVMGYIPTQFGQLAHKTSPSGGARHPNEVYLAALKVKGLSAGLYHYNARSHSLECLHKAQMQDKAVQYCAGNAFVKDTAALFLMTAVFSRSMWKYRFARAYRVVLLDAGHLCQTFCLTATWLGLAPFCTAALNDGLIEKDLGLDGTTESVIYVAAVGFPRRGTSESVDPA